MHVMTEAMVDVVVMMYMYGRVNILIHWNIILWKTNLKGYSQFKMTLVQWGILIASFEWTCFVSKYVSDTNW